MALMLLNQEVRAVPPAAELGQRARESLGKKCYGILSDSWAYDRDGDAGGHLVPGILALGLKAREKMSQCPEARPCDYRLL